MNCHMCGKEKGQPPDRCSGHYMTFQEAIREHEKALEAIELSALTPEQAAILAAFRRIVLHDGVDTPQDDLANAAYLAVKAWMRMNPEAA